MKILHFDEIGYYQGEYEIPGIKFHHAAQDLGVTAWGMNVLSLAPNTTGYPEHDHADDGQQEVYAVLQGSAFLIVDGKETKVSQGQLIYCGPETTRKFETRDEGVVLLAVGAVPGEAYVPK